MNEDNDSFPPSYKIHDKIKAYDDDILTFESMGHSEFKTSGIEEFKRLRNKILEELEKMKILI